MYGEDVCCVSFAYCSFFVSIKTLEDKDTHRLFLSTRACGEYCLDQSDIEK